MMVGERTLTLTLLAALALLPLLLPAWALTDFAIYFAYAIFAASLAFIWGHVGLLSLGHAVYFGLGAYAMSVVTLGMTPLPPWSVIGLISAILTAGVAAYLLGSFFFGGKNLRGAFFGIVTLALAFIFERIAINSTWLGGMNGLMNVPPLQAFGHEIYDPLPLYCTMLAALAAVLILLRWVMQSRFGLLLAGVRENELRAATLGHHTRRLKVLAFTLSGMVAGFAGAVFVAQFGFASPSLIGFSLSADVLIWVALGGRGDIFAAALGAIAVRYLESQLSGSLGTFWPLAAGLFFMLSVLFLPRGLFGEIIARLTRGPSQA
jgi:ABC-type branched-subunit amino acid transport system permease subunit